MLCVIFKAKSQMGNHMAPSGHPSVTPHSAPLGLLQQMIQERNTRQNLPGMQSTSSLTPTQEDNSIKQTNLLNNPVKSLLMQLNAHSNGHPQVPVDSVWPQPPPHITTPFNAQNWLAQVRFSNS